MVPNRKKNDFFEICVENWQTHLIFEQTFFIYVFNILKIIHVSHSISNLFGLNLVRAGISSYSTVMPNEKMYLFSNYALNKIFTNYWILFFKYL